MSMRFPDGWSGLSNPRVRAELLEYLKDASDPLAYQDASETEFLVHFIFDDHEFSPDSTAELGTVLKDLEEAEIVGRFVAALDAAIRPSWRPLNALDAKAWEPVARAAQVAYAKLTQLGSPNSGDV